jgi:hypothetical protein
VISLVEACEVAVAPVKRSMSRAVGYAGGRGGGWSGTGKHGTDLSVSEKGEVGSAEEEEKCFIGVCDRPELREERS